MLKNSTALFRTNGFMSMLILNVNRYHHEHLYHYMCAEVILNNFSSVSRHKVNQILIEKMS